MFNIFKKKKINLFSFADGHLIELSKVPDEVFSKEMMGEGMAIVPSSGVITTPIEGVVESIFPTKHALGLRTKEGVECLIHMGLDTVELNGEPFELHVKEGDALKRGTILASVDLDQLKSANKDSSIIVVFPNLTEMKGSLECSSYGEINRDIEVGSISLK